MIDPFHSSCSSPFFEIEKVIFGYHGELFYPLPLLILMIFDQYMVISDFSFSIANSTPKVHSSGTSGSAVCISLCLISLTLYTFNTWEKYFLHLTTILWESANQIALLVIYYISSSLATLLKVTDTPIQIPNILDLTLCLKIQPPNWMTKLCRLSATVYSIYSQLPSILEAVPPSAT